MCGQRIEDNYVDINAREEQTIISFSVPTRVVREVQLRDSAGEAADNLIYTTNEMVRYGYDFTTDMQAYIKAAGLHAVHETKLPVPVEVGQVRKDEYGALVTVHAIVGGWAVITEGEDDYPYTTSVERLTGLEIVEPETAPADAGF